MAAEEKNRSGFFSRFEDRPDLLLKYKLKTGLFFSFIATLASTEVMVASIIGQQAFPNAPNTINIYLTNSSYPNYPHLTTGVVWGAVGFALSLIAFIYFFNRLKILSISQKKYCDTQRMPWQTDGLRNHHNRPVGYTTKDFYKARGIDPDLYTIAAVVAWEDIEESFKAEAFNEGFHIGIPLDRYKKNEQCGSVLAEEYERLQKEGVIKKIGSGPQEFRVRKISECYNLREEWKEKNKKNFIINTKKNLLFCLLSILVNTEVLISSSVGLAAFPSKINVINNFLTMPLQLKYPHLTAGTVIGMIGILLSLVVLTYSFKKLRDIIYASKAQSNNVMPAEQLNKPIILSNPQ